MESIKLEDIPIRSTGEYLLERVKTLEEEIAMVCGETGVSMTYTQLKDRTKRAAAGLQKLGVNADDVICVMSPNHMDYMVAFYASSLIYATFQPINPTYSSEDIKKVIVQCDTKFIMTVPSLLDKVKQALAANDDIQVIVFGESREFVTFESLTDPKNGTYTTPTRDPKMAVAALMSSSGTTGFPKPVQMTHFNIVANTIQQRCNGLNLPGESCILFLPLFHAYGLYLVTYFIHHLGGKVVIMSKFQPDLYMRLIQEHKPRLLQLVPPVMVMFSKYPGVANYDLSSVDTIVCGAAPLSKEIEENVKSKLKLKAIHQGYGMTEVGVTHMNSRTEFKYKSVGKLLPLVQLKIVDVDTGKPCGTNEEGEVWIKGPQVSRGYKNLPEENSHLFTDDGWTRTGDIGHEDEDGFLFIVDRKKELIKYKAFQVPPAILEDVLLCHDAIADAGVVGMPDEDAGELPRAYIVLKPGKSVSEEDILEFVNGQVAPHMKLRGGAMFVAEIPRTASGKILRKQLREDARAFARARNTNKPTQ